MMKKVILLFAVIFSIVFGVNAQQITAKQITKNPFTNAGLSVNKSDVVVNYDGDPATALGGETATTFIAAIRLTSDELSDYYNGYNISQVMFYLEAADATINNIKIYEGGTSTAPGNLLVEESVPSIQSGWNTHTYQSLVNNFRRLLGRI